MFCPGIGSKTGRERRGGGRRRSYPEGCEGFMDQKVLQEDLNPDLFVLVIYF